MTIIHSIYSVLSAFLLMVLAALVLWVIVVFVLDVSQTRYAIRRNYPVIGRFRYWFEHMGVFFRQYFFAMDREEMPFNRALRNWVYRAAKHEDNTIPFGSTRNIHAVGEVSFVNCPFPTLEEDAAAVQPMVIGADCPHPFTARSLFNISAMSYGALSQVAVQALSHGAAKAGCWMNTGEGGLSPWHLEGGCDIVLQIGTAKYGV
ncbi:MAG: glutamate synthase-related protein, partial [Mariprofundaceae bacterium]|nr:glutamate synthase-related protein [Mariprofundaceae bacterium]